MLSLVLMIFFQIIRCFTLGLSQLCATTDLPRQPQPSALMSTPTSSMPWWLRWTLLAILWIFWRLNFKICIAKYCQYFEYWIFWICMPWWLRCSLLAYCCQHYEYWTFKSVLPSIVNILCIEYFEYLYHHGCYFRSLDTFSSSFFLVLAVD